MAKNSKFKDVLIRALKTFWQATASYIIVNINVIANAITADLEVGGFETLKSVGLSVGVGAIAAGLSALYNGVIRPLIVHETPVIVDDASLLEEPWNQDVIEYEDAPSGDADATDTSGDDE